MSNLESSIRISSCESIPSSPRSNFCRNSFSSCQLSRFYSEPTSPTRSCTSDSPFLWELENEQFMMKSSSPTNPLDEKDNNIEESFEFKTITTIVDNCDAPLSCHQSHLKPVQDQISFADQLFDNGHILPLKPPPRVQYCKSVNSAKSMSGKSVLKPQSVTCWGFNKTDLDPFATALEHVKKEERWNRKIPTNDSRRSRSLSPMKTTTCPPSLCANPNETWNGKMPPHRRHISSNPATRLTYFEPKAFVTTVKPADKTKEAATLAVAPGRSLKLVSAHKSKKVNLFKEFLVHKIGCLGGVRG